jgi:hypothetical protein
MISKLAKMFFILILIYGFLSFCNWSFHPMEWHGFARFLIGFAMFIFIVEISEEV